MGNRRNKRNALESAEHHRQRGDGDRQRQPQRLGEGARQVSQWAAQSRPQQDDAERRRDAQLQADVEQDARLHGRHRYEREQQAGQRVRDSTCDRGERRQAHHQSGADRGRVRASQQRVRADAEQNRQRDDARAEHPHANGAERPSHDDLLEAVDRHQMRQARALQVQAERSVQLTPPAQQHAHCQ